MKAAQGVLVECDPAIRAIILNIESKSQTKYVLEELDDQHLLVSGKSLPELKAKLEDTLRDTLGMDDGESSSSADDGNA